ncbi:MAG TPA: hypothetical protein VN650_02535 [Gemmatimonadaceae bacterium]|nr:hypothetical protein [Gemmatimonadaceae bacterium]
MSIHSRVLISRVLVILTLTSGSLVAQTALPPVRPLGQITAASPSEFASISSVRVLSDGSVLVNDLSARKVTLLDPTLAHGTIIADSTSATSMAYSSRLGGLIAYHGDTTLFVDPQSMSMLVLDGAGKVVRVMSVPKAQDATFLIGGPFGNPGLDASGRLVYRTMLRPKMAPGADGKFAMVSVDSAPIIRFDLNERRADTAGYIKVPAPHVSMNSSEGRMRVTMQMNPLSVTDEWALLPDGNIAVVRGADFRVDLLKPDGTLVKGEKIPFEWQRLTDSSKQAIVDSTRKIVEEARTRQLAIMQGNAPTTTGSTSSATPSGGVMFQMRVENGPPPAGAPATRSGGTSIELPPVEFVPLSEMPDYRPAFSAGAVRADAEGDLWIRTSSLFNGAQVYDVVNGSGQLIDRVQLPTGRTIAGFGKGGLVYLAVRDGTVGVRLEKARTK